MGRNAIPIQYIENKRKREAAFRTRLITLKRKGDILGSLCNVRVTIQVVGDAGEQVGFFDSRGREQSNTTGVQPLPALSSPIKSPSTPPQPRSEVLSTDDTTEISPHTVGQRKPSSLSPGSDYKRQTPLPSVNGIYTPAIHFRRVGYFIKKERIAPHGRGMLETPQGSLSTTPGTSPRQSISFTNPWTQILSPTPVTMYQGRNGYLTTHPVNSISLVEQGHQRTKTTATVHRVQARTGNMPETSGPQDDAGSFMEDLQDSNGEPPRRRSRRLAGLHS